LFEKTGISRRVHLVDFSTQDVGTQLRDVFPARTVPTMRTPDGVIVPDSLAMAEELASRHPEAGIWPSDPKARAIGRVLATEMHSGFGALRSECPMALRTGYDWSDPSPDVRTDLARIEELWTYARKECAPDGPWLCGDYSAVDAFFAPVAGRIAGFNLPVGPDAQAYVDAHLNDLAFRRWRAMGLVRGQHLPWYDQTHPQIPWPGPAVLPATPSDRAGDSENDTCPYSGKPVTDFMELENRVYGFCNPFCRDKTMADPAAWPAFTAIRV